MTTTTATDLVNEFVRAYAFGLSPRLDPLWLKCVAWQQGKPYVPRSCDAVLIEAPPVPRAEDTDPYPRHGG